MSHWLFYIAFRFWPYWQIIAETFFSSIQKVLTTLILYHQIKGVAQSFKVISTSKIFNNWHDVKLKIQLISHTSTISIVVHTGQQWWKTPALSKKILLYSNFLKGGVRSSPDIKGRKHVMLWWKHTTNLLPKEIWLVILYKIIKSL
jgi:hypothetical protein